MIWTRTEENQMSSAGIHKSLVEWPLWNMEFSLCFHMLRWFYFLRDPWTMMNAIKIWLLRILSDTYVQCFSTSFIIYTCLIEEVKLFGRIGFGKYRAKYPRNFISQLGENFLLKNYFSHFRVRDMNWTVFKSMLILARWVCVTCISQHFFLNTRNPPFLVILKYMSLLCCLSYQNKIFWSQDRKK